MSRPAKRAASSTRDGPTAKRRPTQEVLPTSLHGLELFMAPDSQTGYRCVSHSKTSSARPFEVRVSHNGRKEHLGSFETAADAAYCFACYRYGVPHTMPSSAAAPSPTRQSSKLPPPLAADEALRLARAEGLNLLRDPSTVSGYRGVSFSPADSSSRPYRVRITWRGREEFIGSYRTVEEAALRYARRIRQLQQDGPSSNGAPSSPAAGALGLLSDSESADLSASSGSAEGAVTPEGGAEYAGDENTSELTAPEVFRIAAAEGLSLFAAPHTQTGYRGVSRSGRRFEARVSRGGGGKHHLGNFVTAEAAALAVARDDALHRRLKADGRGAPPCRKPPS
ncbi:hypothetical protein Ctob_015919 [Chrysochromulina tobinii]|uniref:AP2/ERF domain-containing protein n=1 Tax=Chrysochromulina tobinii TaxID=1460289 RepID=A0A0M0LQZ0_9EUKA|nr:hypothetical protein Ctob_015919 [Chrysochromulina tobinii]|eukprot:KOO53416.1 hypothetical protein Ctob_015919 [Chrysochromulina sp. CCMP291]